MAIFSKRCNPIILNPITLWSLALPKFKAFVQILLIVNLSLNQTLLIFWLCVRQTWMSQLVLAISLGGVIFLLIQIDSTYTHAWSHSLCEERTSFCTGLISRKICRFLLMFSTGFTSISVLLLFPLLITFFVAMHSFWFYFINIDEVLSINPSANVFVFGDFNIHHEDWLTYSGGTDWPDKLCYNFSISNDLILRWLTFLLRSQTVILTVLFFWIVLFLLMLVFVLSFPPLGKSNHAVASVSIDFPSNSQWDVQFYHIAYDYSCANWDGLHDYLQDVPWKELPIVFSTKVNLLYLLYSTVQRCCLLQLIKQNCLLKTFLRTLILMTQVSLYLFSFLELI